MLWAGVTPKRTPYGEELMFLVNSHKETKQQKRKNKKSLHPPIHQVKWVWEKFLPVLVFIAMIKHSDQKEVGEEWVCFTYTSTYTPSLKEVRGRTQNRAEIWKQELKPEPCRSVSYWLAQQDLLSLLLYIPQDHQIKDGTTHNGLGSPHQVLVKKMPDRRIFWRHFLNWRSLLSDNPSLWQVDRKTASILPRLNYQICPYAMACVLNKILS